MRRVTLGAVVLVLVVALGPAAAARPLPSPDLASEAGKAMTEIAAHVTELERTELVAIETYIATALAALAHGATPRVVDPPRRPAGDGSVGACTGFAIPDYIIWRESGGDPAAKNASGAYGCAQIMPYVWDAHCGELDRGVDGQRECVDRISAHGTNLAPWAATR